MFDGTANCVHSFYTHVCTAFCFYVDYTQCSIFFGTGVVKGVLNMHSVLKLPNLAKVHYPRVVKKVWK